MIRIAILEDNPVDMELLKSLLPSAVKPEYSVREFFSAGEFLNTVRQGTAAFDIVFMDIELGDDSGIRTAGQVSSLCPAIQIIFISQYLKYVSPVYETRHTYFIHKSELKQYLAPAVEKAVNEIKHLRERILDISWNREDFHIFEKDIVYLERTLRTTNIYTRGGCLHTSEKLTSLLSRLGESFVLCQRSFIVNLNFVSAFHSSHLLLSTGKDIPVSRSHLAEVRERLDKFLALPE